MLKVKEKENKIIWLDTPINIGDTLIQVAREYLTTVDNGLPIYGVLSQEQDLGIMIIEKEAIPMVMQFVNKVNETYRKEHA